MGDMIGMDGGSDGRMVGEAGGPRVAMPIMFRVSETLEAMVCPVKQCTHARSRTLPPHGEAHAASTHGHVAWAAAATT